MMKHGTPGGSGNDNFYDEIQKLNNELVALQRDLYKKNELLNRAVDEKNQLLGMTVHDLRSPLGSVRNLLEMLMEGHAGPVTEEQADYLRIMKESVSHMLEMVNDLLDVTKIEAGRLRLLPEPTDLVALIRQELRSSTLLVDRKGIRLEFHTGLASLVLHLDPGRIIQVLDNLISNAVKFSPPGSVVTVYLETKGSVAIVSVRDHGEGIAEHELSRLFTPFGTTSSRGTAGEQSTGLGLLICRRIIEGHGGQIRVESVPGQGSVFSFSLPIGSEGETDAADTLPAVD